LTLSRCPSGSLQCHVNGSHLLALYGALRGAAGHRGWWPGKTRLEIILGAILTQNTAWANVVKALAALRREGMLKPGALRSVPEEQLGMLIRPSGYFRQKARKITAFIRLLDDRYSGSLARMACRDTPALREDLLSVWGIGPETADSILLYAFRRPVFVVDAYTIRVLSRHGCIPEKADYAEVQQLMMNSLPPDEPLYNDFHAQFVWVGHHFCRPIPRCAGCPLARFLP